MKRIATIVLASVFACGMSFAEGYTPPNGFVPDAQTAVAIATAVALPIYGKAVIAMLNCPCTQS